MGQLAQGCYGCSLCNRPQRKVPPRASGSPAAQDSEGPRLGSAWEWGDKSPEQNVSHRLLSFETSRNVFVPISCAAGGGDPVGRSQAASTETCEDPASRCPC